MHGIMALKGWSWTYLNGLVVRFLLHLAGVLTALLLVLTTYYIWPKYMFLLKL